MGDSRRERGNPLDFLGGPNRPVQRSAYRTYKEQLRHITGEAGDAADLMFHHGGNQRGSGGGGGGGVARGAGAGKTEDYVHLGNGVIRKKHRGRGRHRDRDRGRRDRPWRTRSQAPSKHRLQRNPVHESHSVPTLPSVHPDRSRTEKLTESSVEPATNNRRRGSALSVSGGETASPAAVRRVKTKRSKFAPPSASVDVSFQKQETGYVLALAAAVNVKRALTRWQQSPCGYHSTDACSSQRVGDGTLSVAAP